MPGDIRRCEAHGFYEGTDCPVCEATGGHVLNGSRRRQLSKFVSGALRHFPDDAGIAIDGAGWTPPESLVAAVESKYDWADDETLNAVVETDPKGRFERDDDRIRAAYGHSVDVDLEAGDDPVPDTLYHGTAPRNLDAIGTEGLRPMNRQQVHLSEDVADAVEVGSRHANEPVILEIDATAMQTDGHDITKRGETTYTTDSVPPAYLAERD